MSGNKWHSVTFRTRPSVFETQIEIEGIEQKITNVELLNVCCQ